MLVESTDVQKTASENAFNKRILRSIKILIKTSASVWHWSYRASRMGHEITGNLPIPGGHILANIETLPYCHLFYIIVSPWPPEINVYTWADYPQSLASQILLTAFLRAINF